MNSIYSDLVGATNEIKHELNSISFILHTHFDRGLTVSVDVEKINTMLGNINSNLNEMADTLGFNLEDYYPEVEDTEIEFEHFSIQIDKLATILPEIYYAFYTFNQGWDSEDDMRNIFCNIGDFAYNVKDLVHKLRVNYDLNIG